jgi:universal stress protein A
MTTYRRILLALDMTEESPQIAERARALSTALSADLEMLHVVEPLPMMVPDAPEVLAPSVLQTQDEIVRAARERLVRLAAKIELPAERVFVVLGNTKSEIVRAARDREADLIVLGARERHGLSLLVDFTEDAVLHKAPCDVLAVRVKPAR